MQLVFWSWIPGYPPPSDMKPGTLSSSHAADTPTPHLTATGANIQRTHVRPGRVPRLSRHASSPAHAELSPAAAAWMERAHWYVQLRNGE
jgi:hypothetical protein